MNLGLIPARAGSERCPMKNTADLGGIPVIAWAIKTAQESAMFDRLVVSTDDHGIAAVAHKYGCEVIERPPELARPETEMLPVVKHVHSKIECDIIALLQPTSPFRTPEDICSAYDLMKARDADAVVSVTIPDEDLVFDIGHGGRLRPKTGVVVPNGAIYLLTAKYLLSGGNWYTGLTYAYWMPKERSLDIDTKADLELARQIIAKRAAA